MHVKSRNIFLVLGLLVPMQSNAMVVSKGIIPVKENNVLAVGTYHAATPGAPVQDANEFVHILQSLLTGAHLILEMTEDSVGNPLNAGDAFIGNVVARVSQLRREGKTQTVFIAADERKAIPRHIGAIIAILKHLYIKRAAYLLVADPSLTTELNALENTDLSSIGGNVRIQDYYVHLEATRRKMQLIQARCLPGNRTIEQIMRTYDSACTKIKDWLKECTPHDILSRAVVKLFRGCTTGQQLLLRLDQISQPFMVDTDCSFATLIFLEKLLQEASEPRNIVLLLGDLHIQRLKSIFKDESREILFDQTLLTQSAEGSYIEGDLDQMKLDAFSLARHYADVGNLSCIARFFKTHCLHCLKAQDLKQCAGCKITRYCSASCQRKNWPMHRAGCKKQALP